MRAKKKKSVAPRKDDCREKQRILLSPHFSQSELSKVQQKS